MASALPLCKECNERPVSHVTAKTCGRSCRDARTRRLKREAKERNRLNGKHPQATLIVRDQKLLHEVAKEELRPVVREAITTEVMRAAQTLVNLTPRMVELIAEDMESDDKVLRQKAYTLLARYTLGNQSLAPPPAEQETKPMTVVFNLPRPGDPEAPVDGDAEEEVEERTCMECQTTKPVTEFVGPSERCEACHEKLRSQVLEQFG